MPRSSNYFSEVPIAWDSTFFIPRGELHADEETLLLLISDSYTGARANEPSGLAIILNYESALQKVGGTIVGSDPVRWANGKLIKDGQEIWVQIDKGNGQIWLRIVEKKAMEQYLTADAAALGNDIRSMGHAASLRPSRPTTARRAGPGTAGWSSSSNKSRRNLGAFPHF